MSSAEPEQDGRDHEVAFQAALLLGRLRVCQVVPAAVPGHVLAAAAAAAARVGRQLVHITGGPQALDALVLGWDGESAPSPNPSVLASRLGLPPIPTLVWAVCLRAAWPEPERAPFPGLPFQRTRILELCVGLGADRESVERALDRTLPSAGLITASASELRLGPAVAALPGTTVEGLRRGHHLLPVLAEDGSPAGPGRAQPASAHMVPVDQDHVPDTFDHHAVRSAVATLETSRRTVPRGDLPALTDPAVRALTEAALLPCGRQLMQTADGNWTTGYTDPAADALVQEGTGTLTDTERAVLALVLLRTVAIPRARGWHRHSRWTGEPHSVTLQELATNREIPKVAINAALRGLRAAGLVAETTTGRYIPGPALERLPEHRSALLWEDLILVGRPDGHLAAAIVRRRDRTPAQPPTSDRVHENEETDRP
ncbi:hypothetical protein ABT255_17690 [Streptomyces mirabilis]|uniref:hypothetical protein n=1 Tax=Streptomyces mirabilis TaxID=68239 RepID=UPI00331DD933